MDIQYLPPGIPEGSGTADLGAQLFLEKGCAGCHGTNGTDGIAPRLAKETSASLIIHGLRQNFANSFTFCDNCLGLHQPWNAARCGRYLSASEVYSLTAYWYLNDVITDDQMVVDRDASNHSNA